MLQYFAIIVECFATFCNPIRPYCRSWMPWAFCRKCGGCGFSLCVVMALLPQLQQLWSDRCCDPTDCCMVDGKIDRVCNKVLRQVRMWPFHSSFITVYRFGLDCQNDDMSLMHIHITERHTPCFISIAAETCRVSARCRAASKNL